MTDEQVKDNPGDRRSAIFKYIPIPTIGTSVNVIAIRVAQQDRSCLI